MKNTNQSLIAVLLLSFSSGLPLLLSSTTLQAWFTTQGVQLHTIGWLSWIGLPYLLKILWAPFLDRFYAKRLGRRRTWIVITQTSMAILVFIMAFQQWHFDAGLLSFLAVLLAFASASQDTAIDAYRTEILKPEQYGWGSALNTVGYYIGWMIAGAVVVWIAAFWNWGVAYGSVGVLFLVLTGITLYLPREHDVAPPANLTAAFKEALVELFQRSYIVWILIFVLLYKLSDALTFSLNTYFLLHTLQFSLTIFATVSKIVWLAGVLLGTFLGGWLYNRLGLYRSLFLFGILQCVSIVGFIALAFVGHNVLLMIAATFFEKLTLGLTTVPLVAFLMKLCNQRFTAMQFAVLSACAALSRVVVGPFAADLVTHLGWTDFYGICLVAGIPALLCLRFLKHRVAF